MSIKYYVKQTRSTCSIETSMDRGGTGWGEWMGGGHCFNRKHLKQAGLLLRFESRKSSCSCERQLAEEGSSLALVVLCMYM